MQPSEAASHDPEPTPIDWEAFYRDYRKPGYIAGYEIQTQLGSGAFGMVFKATKESINKPYAIKFLKVDDIEIRTAVVRELDAVRYFAQVDHPNLVSIEDLGDVDGIPYIVMAFAGDDTLRRRIDAGDLTREHALNIFGQVCRGVHALHEHSLVHFDIKPANVYLKGEVARIGDYGLSKLVTDSRNSLSMGRGTPYYMAPELLRRKGDTRSDIYALGVMLYEMMCGEPPFRGDSEWEVLKKHEEEAPSIPDSVAEPERSVILRAMAKNPDGRFQSVAEMLGQLQGVDIDATAHGMPTPPPVPIADQPPPIPPRPPGRRRARAQSGSKQPFTRDVHTGYPRVRPTRKRSATGTLFKTLGCLTLIIAPILLFFAVLIPTGGPSFGPTPRVEIKHRVSETTARPSAKDRLLAVTEQLRPEMHNRAQRLLRKAKRTNSNSELAKALVELDQRFATQLHRELELIPDLRAAAWCKLIKSELLDLADRTVNGRSR